MTKPHGDFEARIRRVLAESARELEVRSVAWPGPSARPPRRRARVSLGGALTLGGALIAVVIAVGVLALAGHQHASPTHAPIVNPPPPAPTPAVGPFPAVAFEPQLSPGQRNEIDAAYRAVVARDRACGSRGPELTYGLPSRALASMFNVLDRPATSATKLRGFLRDRRAFGPLATIGTFNQELYVNQIRLSRTAFGARFYVIPAGNVTGQRGVPGRCGPEQVAALRHRISYLGASPHARTQILAAQRRYLAYLSYLAHHPEGICATFVPAHATSLDLADNFGCATVADFERWGVLADASAYLGHGIGVFWTVVPDDVATVTLRFTTPNGRPLATDTVRPVGNVVVAKEPWHAPYQSGFPSTIILRAPDGSLLKNIRVTPNMITLCGYGC